MNSLIEYGYLGLFAGSFLAATILPFSSEVMLTGMIYSGYDLIICLIVATAGNWIGGMTSYWLGYLGKIEWLEKYFRIKPDKIEKARKFVKKQNGMLAFFCWLPFVGDLIAVAMGVMRTNIFFTALFMLLGKAIRYVVWGWISFAIN